MASFFPNVPLCYYFCTNILAFTYFLSSFISPCYLAGSRGVNGSNIWAWADICPCSVSPSLPPCCPPCSLLSPLAIVTKAIVLEVGNPGWGTRSVPQRDGGCLGRRDRQWGCMLDPWVRRWTRWAPSPQTMGPALICLACNRPEKALALVSTSTVGIEYTLALTLLAQVYLSPLLQVMTRESSIKNQKD